MRQITSVLFTAKERANLLEILMVEIDTLFLDTEPEILLTEEWDMFATTNRLFEKHLLMYHMKEENLAMTPSFLQAREFYNEYKDALIITTQSFDGEL